MTAENNKPNIGYLTNVPLRDIWPHEARDLTPWLAEKEHLAMLANELKLGEIELKSIEQKINDSDGYAVDIFGIILDPNTSTYQKVIIENQLEPTDHKHLGELLTYAAGLDANHIIWVTTSASEGHRQAIEWLNENTNDKLNFFLVKVEAFKIGNSAPAPKFTVISQPNGWMKELKQRAEEWSDTQVIQFHYWQKYFEVANGNSDFKKLMNPHKPNQYNYTSLSIGKGSKCNLVLFVRLSEDRVGVEVSFNKERMDVSSLNNWKNKIEEILQTTGYTYNAEKFAGIRFYKEDILLQDTESWDESINWQLEKAVELRKAVLETVFPA